MAEQVTEDKCKALYALLAKEELSDDEKKQISNTIQENPNILLHGDFAKCIKIPDLAFEYTNAEQFPALLEKNAHAMREMKQVLDNLKNLTVQDEDTVKPLRITHNGKQKTAAAYLLDNMLLDNGEIIGTQMAKNIHFLGTAKRQSLISESDSNFDETAGLYQSLYFGKTPYGANANARNASGQKVSDVMKPANDVRKMEEDTKPVSTEYEAEKAKEQVFMMHPDETKMTFTIDELRMRRYQGKTMTVEQSKMLQQAEEEPENEAKMEHTDVNPHLPEKKDHKNKFRDMDILQFLYEDCFLEGLSWCFDKLEDCADLALDRLIDNASHNRAVRAHEAEMSRKDSMKKFVAVEHAFGEAALSRREKARAQIMNRQKDFAAEIALLDVDYAHLSPEKEAEMKSRYGESFVEKQKARYQASPDARKAFVEFLKIAPQGFENLFKHAKQINEFAMQQVELEMRNEVMKHQKAWWKKGSTDFRTDDDLMAEYDSRCAKRRSELIEAVGILEKEVKMETEAAWLQIDPSDKKKQDTFVQEHVLTVIDKRINETTDRQEQSTLAKRKKQFEETYAKIPEEQRLGYVLYSVSSLKVDEFLTEQGNLTLRARALQDEDIKEGRYDINGYTPNSNTADTLRMAETRRKTVIAEGAKDKQLFPEIKEDVEATQGLYEAVFDSEKTKVNTVVSEKISCELDCCDARRHDTAERKKKVMEVVSKIKTKTTGFRDKVGNMFRREGRS